MPYALLSTLWISALGLFATAAAGLHFWGNENPLGNHVVAALSGVTLALFAHTMTMFYFIGSAKKIKEFMVNWETEIREEYRARTIVMKRKLFPWMMGVCIVLMAAFLSGGAYDARLISRSFHQGLAYAAILLHVHVATLESLYIFKNIDLIHEINDLARRKA